MGLRNTDPKYVLLKEAVENIELIQFLQTCNVSDYKLIEIGNKTENETEISEAINGISDLIEKIKNFFDETLFKTEGHNESIFFDIKFNENVYIIRNYVSKLKDKIQNEMEHSSVLNNSNESNLPRFFNPSTWR